jgi:hypothetical protein
MTVVDARQRQRPVLSVGPQRAVNLRPRSVAVLALTSLVGVVAYVWPFLVGDPQAAAGTAHAQDAVVVMALLLPLLVLVTAIELGEGGFDARAVGLLGVLTAAGAALRMAGGGVSGFSPMFFLIVLAGSVLGSGFGFVLGATTMFASAIITGGISSCGWPPPIRRGGWCASCRSGPLDPEALLFPAVVFAAQRPPRSPALSFPAAFAVFVEVVDLTAAGRCVTARPDTMGICGGGGGAGRSGEPSRPAEVDDHTCRVDDHPADFVEQAVGCGFGRVDVVAVPVRHMNVSGSNRGCRSASIAASISS